MGTEDAVIGSDEVSDLESKIIRQVEYYFGDYNLCRDGFLKHVMKENDGWVSMDIMVKFNRLKNLSDDISVITTALKKSPNKLLEVNEDGTKIRRCLDNPLPENTTENRENVESRSVYVKGFYANTTLDELLEFFKSYKDVENIHMRRTPNRKFKGSVFVTFSTKEDAEKFQQMEGVKYKSTELIKEMKADHQKRKNEWFENIKKERAEQKKKKKAKTENNEGVKEESYQSDEESKNSTGKGCLLKLSGLGEDTMWEHIKEVLSPHGTIAYVDYFRGNPQAVVRFESGIAAEVLEKVATETDGAKTIKIMDNDAIAVVLEGDEELDYWKNIAKSKADRRHSHNKCWETRGGRYGRRGKGKFQQRGKRKRDEYDAEPEDREKKLPKTEAEEKVLLKIETEEKVLPKTETEEKVLPKIEPKEEAME